MMQYDPCPETLAGGEGALGDRVELERPCIGQVHKVGLGIFRASRGKNMMDLSEIEEDTLPLAELGCSLE